MTGTSNHSAKTPAARLSEFEAEMIDLFVTTARVLGQPRSVAEIYGLLFVSPEPLTLDDFIERLKISKGSGSQGLKYLRSLGAIRTVYVPQSRRTHYEAVAELRKLAGQFLKTQIQPTLEDGERRLARIQKTAAKLPVEQQAYMEQRVTMLQSWGKNTRRLLPVITKILGK